MQTARCSRAASSSSALRTSERMSVMTMNSDDIEFHELVGEEGKGMTGGMKQIDISQFVSEGPKFPE